MCTVLTLRLYVRQLWQQIKNDAYTGQHCAWTCGHGQDGLLKHQNEEER